MKVEWIALAVNVAVFCQYVWQWHEPGKMLYWGGTILVVGGLLLMKG